MMHRIRRNMLSSLVLIVINLNGYGQALHDILPQWKYFGQQGDALYNHLAGHAFQQLDERKSLIADLASTDDWTGRQRQIREDYAAILGPFPEKSPLNAVVTGTVERNGIRVEKVYFESLPNYYVTGALFLPINRPSRVPVVLFCSGHSALGFRSPNYQREILNLVKKGFAVFAFDPIGQGERRQYPRHARWKSFGPTQEHSYGGSLHFLLGRSPAYFFIWDGIRAIDYLCSRPEIDTTRIGITGRSGGGTQTALIAAFDSRIQASATECYITTYEMLMLSRGPQDAEQNFAKGIYHGLDIPDLLIGFAPKPAMIASTTRDIFSIQGARDVYDEVKNAYANLGDTSYFHMVEDDTTHASTRSNREAIYRFFQGYLANPGNAEEEELEVFSEEELLVTQQGNVYLSLGGHNLRTLAATQLEGILGRKAAISGKSDLLERVRRVTRYQHPQQVPSTIFAGRYRRKDYDVEACLFKGPAGYYLPVYWFKPHVQRPQGDIVLLLDDRGKREAAADGEMADSLARLGFQVVLPDLSGYGELANGYIKGGDAYVQGIPLNLWYTGLMVNRTPLLVRMQELSMLIDWIKREDRPICGIASGVLTTDLLHIASLRSNDIRSMMLVDPLISFQSVVEVADYHPKYLMSAVDGMMKQYDLPELMDAYADENSLLLVNPCGGDGSAMDLREAKQPFRVACGSDTFGLWKKWRLQ